MAVAPPGQRPNPRQYPIAMANEPRPSTIANAMLREWVLGREHIVGIPQHVNDDHFFGAGLVACVNIPRNTEICWHYGPRYQSLRNYPVGNPCDVQTDVHPVQSLGHPLPYNAVSPMIDTPSNSDESDDDPSYSGLWRAEHKLFISQTLATFWRDDRSFIEPTHSSVLG